MKPVIKYRGGRTKEIPHIMQHVPRFSGRYVEPFFGDGAFFSYLEPRETIISDINKRLINLYEDVRNYFPELRKELNEIEALYEINKRDHDTLRASALSERVVGSNEALYYLLRDMLNNKVRKECSDALLYCFISKTAYSSMIRYSSDGEFNVPYDHYKHLDTQRVSFSHSQLLKRAEIHDVDYSKILGTYSVSDPIFLDPPYDCVFSDYGNVEYEEGFNEGNHRKLVKGFKDLSCKSLMIIGRTSLTEELYKEFIIDEYKKAHTVNIRSRLKSEAKRIIVANYKKDWDNVQIITDNVNREYTVPGTAQIMLFKSKKKYHDKS